MASAPPIYTTTGTDGQVFVKTEIPSTQIIPCNLSFAKGDYVGILGACGTATMHNSYGGPNVASSILGSPVTLSRFITQANLNTTRQPTLLPDNERRHRTRLRLDRRRSGSDLRSRLTTIRPESP